MLLLRQREKEELDTQRDREGGGGVGKDDPRVVEEHKTGEKGREIAAKLR